MEKYSPTVSAAYQVDQDWHNKYNYTPEHGWDQYDFEGFDSYGYGKDGIDRAGNSECAYYSNDASARSEEDFNYKYDNAVHGWGFDGTKPVLRG